jgi:hypothetical protein
LVRAAFDWDPERYLTCLLCLLPGFVSFDNPTSAAQAIATMNGYVVGSRPLKVSIKAQTSGAPY